MEPHILFFPFMANGHLIPMVDMAKLFATRGVRASIVTTKHNASFVRNSIGKAKSSGYHIDILLLDFPSAAAGLPEGVENLNVLTSMEGITLQVLDNFLVASALLQIPFEQLLDQLNPDCVIADIFFYWANESCSKFRVPKFIFHGTSAFARCVSACVQKHRLYSSDLEEFLVPDLPGSISLSKKQISVSDLLNYEGTLTPILKMIEKSDRESHGVVFNSFREIEEPYAEFYDTTLGRKAWFVGPVHLCNSGFEEKANRGGHAAESACLRWLDDKTKDSVVLVSFGSVARFSDSQLREIAMALEACGHGFVWVVRKKKKEGEEEEWLPLGFEERTAERGIIVREWAPQVLILEHEAVGAFVTHCGWNSTLEGIASGKTMVTWPVSAEQFYNEKMVTEILKIGVPVGSKKIVRLYGDSVGRDAIEKAISAVMVGDQAEAMRMRTRNLREKAKAAMEEGGSSHCSLNHFIENVNF